MIGKLKMRTTFLFFLMIMSACPPPSRKVGDVQNKNLEVIINDQLYTLHTVYDGDHDIRVLVPSCEGCKIPFTTNIKHDYSVQCGKVRCHHSETRTSIVIPPQIEQNITP